MKTCSIVAALLACTLMAVVGCPQGQPLSTNEPPTSNMPPGVYTGTATDHLVETDAGQVVADQTVEIPLTVIVNEQGQMVSPLTGQVVRIAEPVPFQVGQVDLSLIPTAITPGDLSVVISGRIEGSLLDHPATGYFTYTFRALSSDTIDVTATLAYGTQDVLHTVMETMTAQVHR